MSHPLCIRCHPTDGSDVLNSSTADANYLWYDISAPTEGDIYQLEQTVTQPIHHILRGRPLPRQLTLTSPAPTASFTTAKSGWLKRRPCLIEAILEETEGPGFARIYAMATYGGTTIDDMADIYHHFSVGVAPGAVDPTHIHTVPEWRGKEGLCQWIIAYPYSIPIADVMKGTRWTLAGMADAAPRSHCRVTPPMRAYLRRLSAIKETEWQKRCQDDKGLRRRMLKEAFQARRTDPNRTDSPKTGFFHDTSPALEAGPYESARDQRSSSYDNPAPTDYQGRSDGSDNQATAEADGPRESVRHPWKPWLFNKHRKRAKK
ncbi:hypothetical protein C8Q72DRAFT_193071 [Fomitopsis betulina]|nr:hypothetical protein C8Q72DRAFT_193071 [Fomitopsis betulina]